MSQEVRRQNFIEGIGNEVIIGCGACLVTLLGMWTYVNLVNHR